MIKSDLEYNVTSDRVQVFQNAIQELNRISERGDVDPDLVNMQMNALKYNLSVLEGELSEYEYGKSQKTKKQNLKSLANRAGHKAVV